MAVRTSNGTGGGNYGTGATWSGGVAPVEGDSVIIASTDTVTVDGTYIAGDDTTTAFTINGKLSFSRSVNSSLTVKGQILTAATTTANLDIGTIASPIPLGIRANLILNYSASPAVFKYGLYIADLSSFSFVGATRQTNTTLTNVGGISAGATSMTVADCTGWQTGDRVVIAETDGTWNHEDVITISTVTPGTGTTGTITWVGGTTYAHAQNAPVGHFSSTATIKAYSITADSFVNMASGSSTSVNNTRVLKYGSFEYIGADINNPSTKGFIYSTITSTSVTPIQVFDSCSHYNNSSGNSLHSLYFTFGARLTINNHAWYSNSGSGCNSIYLANGSTVYHTNCVCYRTINGFTSAYSEGGVGCTFTDCKFWGNGGYWGSFQPIIGGIFTRCQWHSTSSGNGFFSFARGGPTIFDTCSIGGSDLPGTPFSTYIMSSGSGNGLMDVTFKDCKFVTPATSFVTGLATSNPQWIARISNKELNPLLQFIYKGPAGIITRDDTSKISGTTSIKFSPTDAVNPLTQTWAIAAPNGKLVGVSGKINRDTANVTTVTLSGLGITPSTYTCSGALNTNETFFVSGTNNSGTDGLLVLTVSTVGTSGNMWVDNISAPQSVAIDFGEMGFWANAQPADIITANYVSALDVWNTPESNVNVAGSMGKAIRFIKTLLLIK
jgi:hypothetical protein